MEIRFYSGFKKRLNSTKQPTTASLTLTGTLKEACSIENPVISIEMDNSPAQYVYAYIPDFGRYYFVNDWVSNLGIWECHLTEDYLASWKTSIGNTDAYIDRCASEADNDIIDTQYLTTTNYTITPVVLTSSYFQSDDSQPITGCFVLGVIDSTSGADSQTGGAVTYYVLTPAQCKSLMSYLLSDTFLSANGFPQQMTTTQQISNDMAKAFVRPIDYIVSCVWYPFPVIAFSSSADHVINVGYWAIGQTVATGKIVQYMKQELVRGQLAVHPQAATRGTYLNYSPYTRIDLFIPPFGSIPIDVSYRRLGEYIVGEIRVDPYTGIGKLTVFITSNSNYNYDFDGAIVAEASAMFGVPVQLGQINGDFFHSAVEVSQAAIHTVGGVASAISLNGSDAAIHASAAVSHVANAIDYLAPQVRTSGTDGSRLLIKQAPRLTCCFTPIVDEDNAEMGRPLRKIRTIKNLSGFIKCFEVSVDYACFDSEKQEILNHLLSGFFYE